MEWMKYTCIYLIVLNTLFLKEQLTDFKKKLKIMMNIFFSHDTLGWLLRPHFLFIDQIYTNHLIVLFATVCHNENIFCYVSSLLLSILLLLALVMIGFELYAYLQLVL